MFNTKKIKELSNEVDELKQIIGNKKHDPFTFYFASWSLDDRKKEETLFEKLEKFENKLDKLSEFVGATYVEEKKFEGYKKVKKSNK